MIDWFKKAKEAKEKKEKEKKDKPRYGMLGSKSKSYKEAQDALASADN